MFTPNPPHFPSQTGLFPGLAGFHAGMTLGTLPVITECPAPTTVIDTAEATPNGSAPWNGDACLPLGGGGGGPM